MDTNWDEIARHIYFLKNYSPVCEHCEITPAARKREDHLSVPSCEIPPDGAGVPIHCPLRKESENGTR